MTIAIVLLLVGLALIVLELLFPSFGALGIAAALALIAAIVLAFRESHSSGLTFLISTAVLVPAAILLGMKLLPRSPLGKVLVAQGASFTDAAAVDRRDRELLNKEGVAENLLRPVGTALFDGRRVDVVTRGEPIPANARVRVIEVEGNRVVVVAAENTNPQT
jgi:membrane-bound serine protease (ClpP class)